MTEFAYYETSWWRMRSWTGPRGGKHTETLGWRIPATVPDRDKLLRPPEGDACPRCGGTEFSQFPMTFVSCVPCEDECMRAYMIGLLLSMARHA